MVYKTLKEIFGTLDEYDWREAIYIPQTELTLESTCLIDNPDDAINEDSDLTPAAEKENLLYGLGINDLKDIKKNLIAQGQTEIDDVLFLEAFKFYLANDAFIKIK